MDVTTIEEEKLKRLHELMLDGCNARDCKSCALQEKDKIQCSILSTALATRTFGDGDLRTCVKKIAKQKLVALL